MPLPGDLTTTIVTGQFVSTSGAPVTGRITFSPTSTLLDPTSQMVIPATGSSYPLSSMGTFTTDPLASTDNTDLEPQGWAYEVRVELQDLQPYTFTCFLPSSPSTVDLSALEPVFPAGTTLGPPGPYLPSGGGTETGTLVLDALVPLKVPGAQDGYILVSDASGNFTPQANAAGAASSIDGVTVMGTTVAGRTIVATSPTVATWQLPLQVDTSAGDIANLAASASAGVLTQAAAADHAHATTGLVTTTGTQSIGGAKTFTSPAVFSAEVTVPTPTNTGDAVTKAYADSISLGLSVKPAAVAATVGTETFVISSGNVTQISATTTLDGVSPNVNDFVLIKDAPAASGTGSSLSSQPGNGLYQVTGNTTNLSVSRATAMSGSNGPAGAFVFVETGTANKGSGYVVTTPAGAGAFTYGSGNIQWTQFSSAASVTADGTTLHQSGGVISLATPVAAANLPAATTSTQGAVILDNTALDIKALGSQSAGTSTQAAKGDHVHPTTGLVTSAGLTATPLPLAQGGTNAATAVAALASLGGAAVAGDLGGTSASPTVAKIQGTAISSPSGGTASFLNASGTWTAPPGGGASLDTSTTPHALGTASPGTGPGASPADHAHPTTGLLTTGTLVGTTQGGTGVNASTTGLSLAAMAGLPGGATAAQYLKGGGTGGAIVVDTIKPADLPGASTAAAGAVTFDGTPADFLPSPGTAAAGGTTALKLAAYSDHVHGQPPMLAPTGLTGATTASRYVGGVNGAAPATGAFLAGDFVVDKSNGSIWICTTAGSPGTWAHIVAGTGVLTNPLTAVGDIIRGGTVTSGTAALTRLGIGSTGQVLTVSGGVPAWAAPSAGTDWLNVVTAYGADNTGVADATIPIQNALNAAPTGGTVYLPAGTYKTTKPLIIPPAVTLLGSGRSLAYDGGSQPMTISTSVLAPVISGSFSATYGGQAVTGVLAMLGITLNGGGFLSTPFTYSASGSPPTFTATGSSYSNNDQVVLSGGTAPTGLTNGTIYYVTGVSGATFQLAASYGSTTPIGTSGGSGTVTQEYGSANQTVRNITINGSAINAGTVVRGIEAWGAVWGVKLEDVGIYHMPDSGIVTNKTTFGSDTAHFPDFWQLIGVHIAGCHNTGAVMTSMGDSYFIGCESTGNSATGGNFANGWTISGDNIKISACKAEYNTGIGLSIARGTASRPILINGFGTDGNGHYGIQITGTSPGAGPVVLNGVGLNYDGQNNGAGGNWAALSITGACHVSATGLHVTTGIPGGSAYPAYAVQCPSTFTGVLQIDNSEIYGGTAAVSLDPLATGVVRYGPNVLTGSGNWNAQTLANVVQAPSPQTDFQQYAKYWSPAAGTAGNWVSSTTQQPRESLPWYSATGSPSMTAGQMLCAVIPVQPGDVITKLGFVVGTAATFGTTAATQHWWVALYTTGGTFLGQSADQTNTALPGNTKQILTLTVAGSGITLPYTVPAGVYALLGAVMVNVGTGGSPVQPIFRGISTSSSLMGGSTDLFTGATQYAALAAGPFTNAAPSPLGTVSASGNLIYVGAC